MMTVSGNLREATDKNGSGLLTLFSRLLAYKILNWNQSSDDPSDNDREQVELDRADVITSLLRGSDRHVLVIDIDHPAWLVKSTTEGHFHLYVDVPYGIPSDIYFNLLDALANANVIEGGYMRASIQRGFTSLRLPWIKKVPVS